MGDIMTWLGTHPFESEEFNVFFWIAVVGIILIRIVLWFGGPGSGSPRG